MANAYAALKELEFFNRLDIETDSKGFEFHYDIPLRIGDHPIVKNRPFEMTYIIDLPRDFHTPDLINAVADTIYLQIYSPFGEKQASDYDNYAKQARQLYPSDLSVETKKGYTNFYGSLGLCVLLLPDDDILRYCTLRFAADAVKAYLLMADPDILPDDLREQFNRFKVPQAELKKLNQEAQKRKVDESYVQKIEFLSEKFKEKPDSFWGRLGQVVQGIDQRFQNAVDKLLDDAIGEELLKISNLSPNSIQEHSWTPDTAHQKLRRELQSVRDTVSAKVAAISRGIQYDFWPRFLAEAGPPSNKNLNPYEQRYVLLALFGLSSKLRNAPLSGEAISDALARQVEAAGLWSDNTDDGFAKLLKTKAEELRETAPKSFWAKMMKKDEAEAQFEAAKRSALDAFNQRVAALRKALRASVEGRVLKQLRETADEKILDVFRDIDFKGALAAIELESQAETYRQKGSFREKLLDGSVIEYWSEANQYAIDEECLMSPNGERLWDWYYDDQIGPALSGTDQVEAVQEALAEALKPKFTADGLEIPRTAERIIQDIVFNIRAKVEPRLTEKIKGPDGRAGLLIDDAIALEAAYLYLLDTPRPGDRKKRLADFRRSQTGTGESLIPGALWNHTDPEISSRVRAAASEKIHRAAIVKSKVLGDLNADFMSDIKKSEQILIGMHKTYSERGPFSEVFKAVPNPRANQLKDWYDTKRIVFYHYLLGVPPYVFRRVTGELQTAYRKHQSLAQKAWYLHIDRNLDGKKGEDGNWQEGLSDLDPIDIRQELDATRALKLSAYFAMGVLSFDEDGCVVLSAPDGGSKSFAKNLDDVASALRNLQATKPNFFELVFKEAEDRMAIALKRKRLDDDLRNIVETFKMSTKKRLAKIEGDEEDDTPRTTKDGLAKLCEAADALLKFKPMKKEEA